MPKFRSIAALLAAGAVGLTGVAVTASSAGASSTSSPVVGGTTTVVITPSTAGALLGASILPLPVNPASETPASQAGGATVKVSFPVIGGQLNLSNVTGTILHTGGLDFYDVATAKYLVLEDFDINLGTKGADITAEVPALATRVPVFLLNLAAAKIVTSGNTVDVSNIAVTLTATGASALDAALGTNLFTPGLSIGIANTEDILGASGSVHLGR